MKVVQVLGVEAWCVGGLKEDEDHSHVIGLLRVALIVQHQPAVICAYRTWGEVG